jgi:hypothetical protein
MEDFFYGSYLVRRIQSLQRWMFPKAKAHLDRDFVDPVLVQVTLKDTEIVDGIVYYCLNITWHYSVNDDNDDIESTKSETWTVKKRYSDFNEFYREFRSFDKDNRIPQPDARFPQKDLNNGSLHMMKLGDDSIESRRNELEKWICGYEEICSTDDGIATQEKEKLRQALAFFYCCKQHVGKMTKVGKVARSEQQKARRAQLREKLLEKNEASGVEAIAVPVADVAKS